MRKDDKINNYFFQLKCICFLKQCCIIAYKSDVQNKCLAIPSKNLQCMWLFLCCGVKYMWLSHVYVWAGLAVQWRAHTHIYYPTKFFMCLQFTSCPWLLAVKCIHVYICISFYNSMVINQSIGFFFFSHLNNYIVSTWHLKTITNTVSCFKKFKFKRLLQRVQK